MKVLVVVAHPDDELLGVGPYLLQLIARQQAEVHVVSFTENSTRHGKPVLDSLMACKQSCKMLGAVSCTTFQYRDQHLDYAPFLDLIKFVEMAAADIDPDYVLTHSQYDLNRDHRIVSEAVRVACRNRKNLKGLGEFKTVSSDNGWQGEFAPTQWVNLTEEEIDRTWEIFSTCYPDEVQEAPLPRSREGFKEAWGKGGGWLCSLGLQQITLPGRKH